MYDGQHDVVQIRIRDDGKVIWINTPDKGCVCRICQIKELHIEDNRREKQEVTAEDVGKTSELGL